MAHFDKIFKLHQIFKASHYPVSLSTIREELGKCSRATANRCIRDLRDYLDAPIEYNRAERGYSYNANKKALYELPGLWFNAAELQALITISHWLTEI